MRGIVVAHFVQITMIKLNKIAVFGSLKRGWWNHDRFKLGEPIDTSRIRGAMYYCGYPHLYRPEKSNPEHIREHEVEIYEVTEDVYRAITGMERGAGYQEYKTTLLGDSGSSHEVTIYYTDDDYETNYPFLEEFTQEEVNKTENSYAITQ